MSDRDATTMTSDEARRAAAAQKPAKPPTDWWGEARGILWLVLAVLAFHSFVAKPFYIPSESMMPTLIKGDRLVVTKYPYGWSYVSPSIGRVPGPIGEALGRLTGQEHLEIPFVRGRLLGSAPDRGDVVIVKPRGQHTDYIKRVIGLPGDVLAMEGGALSINGRPVRRRHLAPALIPIDDNVRCDAPDVPPMVVTGPDGRAYCQMQRVRETLPNGVSYDTLDLADRPEVDDFAPLRVPAGHVFLMGDNRDQSADSRVPAAGSGLDGPLPIENIGGRAEFITFSLDGSSQLLDPVSWFTALRGGRAGTSLRPATGG